MSGHGGRRLRSGRKPDPLSARSLERRGAFVQLPEDGYDGPVPDFPLPDSSPREVELWSMVWGWPQAAMWAEESWRQYTAAMWCRWSARMELPDATAATGTVTARLADAAGLTPSGMTDQGWTIGPAPDHTRRRPAPPRPGLSMRGEDAAADTEKPADGLGSRWTLPDGRPTSLGQARRRAQERDRASNGREWDPRDALREDYQPDPQRASERPPPTV